jgi:exodeoxyribonuclease V beta subunit
MKPFNLYKESLDGLKLIEASAGTGKTYTLSGLYVRYIMEKRLLPEDILVLTFTNAATFELKTRLREQLIQCKNHLHEKQLVSESENKELFDLYEGFKQVENATKHIDLALICFDQAAVFTINGFCQKILLDYNSQCGSPVLNELISTGKYTKQIIYDFWRTQQMVVPDVFLSALPTIDSVVSKLTGLLNKSHYQDVKPISQWSGVGGLKSEFDELKCLWDSESDNVLDYMLSGCFGAKYRASARDKFKTAMDEYFLNLTVPKTNLVERFCNGFLENERKSNGNIPTPKFCILFEKLYQKLNELPLSYMYECWLYLKQRMSSLLSDKGMYSYSDQIKIVHDSVLNDNLGLKALISKQWPCVMVDEFQDTDSLQYGIFKQCFLDDSHDVIFVGDPKQAIYDFRGADVYVYQEAKKDVGSLYSLGRNWRSSSDVVDVVNAMFSHVGAFDIPWLEYTPSLPRPDSNATDAYSALSVINCSLGMRKERLANELKALIVDDSFKGNLDDIAILVSSNSQALDLYEYLLGQDVDVCLWSESGIFSTMIAKQVYYFLRALCYPSKSNIFTCMHGALFDVTINDLHKRDIEELVLEFVEYAALISKSGVDVGLKVIFESSGVFGTLLKRLDGERCYTDLQHVLELIRAQDELGLNLEQVEQWLSQVLVAEVGDVADVEKRRLESDGQKISIMTLHKSKGLEFEVVFIPYADNIKAKKVLPGSDAKVKPCIATHDEEFEGSIYWRGSAYAKQQFLFEANAEMVRTLYVALTRAKSRIYMGADLANNTFEGSPISKLYANVATNKLLCCEVNSTVPVSSVGVTSKQEEFTGQCRELDRSFARPESVYSFSGLSRLQNISYGGAAGDDGSDVKEFSDYLHFPKGPKSGTMQHEIFENLDFNASDDVILPEVVKQLARYDFDERWANCLAKHVGVILGAQMWSGGPSLNKITTSVDEMEFILPVHSFNKSMIGGWLSEHRGRNTSYIQNDIAGFLTGFIDLIFEFEGKYYVLDYKSNHLGFNVDDYSNGSLTQAIEHHYYDLQYLLYTVALVKFLKVKISDFDYDTHIGGVAYMFLRGVNGSPGNGVCMNKPDEGLIENMLEVFDAK